MGESVIRVGGAREHNLKDVSLELPRDRLTVITGPSGSGKSSLAFDTIFAEGQRKYVESLSSYARQFLDQLQKPDVDFIEGLSPAIAIEQRSSSANPRSTIATTTELYDYLRLLYAHIGQPHCPESGDPIGHETTSDIIDGILELDERTRVMLLAPVVIGEKGEFRDVLERLAREGFVRARVDGELIDLGTHDIVRLDAKKKHRIEAVVDRLVIDDKVRSRLSDSVETALKWGNGVVVVLKQAPNVTDRNKWMQVIHSNRLYSPKTGKTFDPLTPKHFSFNSPLGACVHCDGLGQRLVFDEELIVPDRSRSLEEGAVEPWRKGAARMVRFYQQLLEDLANHYKVAMTTPFEDLAEDFQRALVHGSGTEKIGFTIRKGNSTKVDERVFEGVLAPISANFRGHGE